VSEAGVEEVLQAAAQMRVVRGAPDEVEVAALVASLAAVASRETSTVADEPPVRSEWARPLRTATPSPRAAGDAWRWSLR
jgi:methylthioribose-1-phosphate isomerase